MKRPLFVLAFVSVAAMASAQSLMPSRGSLALRRAFSLAIIDQRLDGGVRLDGQTQGVAVNLSCYGDGTTTLKQVATNDLGVYTGAVGCVGGTLRLDVSATAVTSAVPFITVPGTVSLPALNVSFNADTSNGIYAAASNELDFAIHGARSYIFTANAWLFNSDTANIKLGTGQDIQVYRSGTKTLKLDTDGAGGLLTAVNFASSALQVSGTSVVSGTTHLSAGSGMAVANVGANSCGTTAATIVGNNNAFEITVGATAGTQCRVTFTFAATAKWDCTVTDGTTTIATRATPVDTTHTDFLGAFVAGDVVIGLCFPR